VGVEVLRKKVLLFFLFAPSKNEKFNLGFRKKTCTSLFCRRFKKSEQQQQQQQQRDDEHNEHAIETVVVKTERR